MNNTYQKLLAVVFLTGAFQLGVIGAILTAGFSTDPFAMLRLTSSSITLVDTDGADKTRAISSSSESSDTTVNANSSSSESSLHNAAMSSAGSSSSSVASSEASSVTIETSSESASSAAALGSIRKTQTSISSAAPAINELPTTEVKPTIVPVTETNTKAEEIFLAPIRPNPLILPSATSSTEKATTAPSVTDTTMNSVRWYEEKEEAGCITLNGTWTTVRTDCASNQRSVFTESVKVNVPALIELPAASTPQEEKKVETFLHERQLEKRVTAANTNLKTLVSDTEERLNALKEIISDDSPARAVIEEKLGEIQKISLKVESGELSADDAKIVAAEFKAAVSEVQSAVAPSLPREPVLFRPLYEKFRRYVQAYPAIARELASQGVSIDQSAASAYLEGLSSLGQAELLCKNDSLRCQPMHATLDSIEKIYVAVAVSLRNAGREDLQKNIDAILAN